MKKYLYIFFVISGMLLMFPRISHATITKTIGAAGDYASIALAWAAIPGIQNPIIEPWILEIRSDYVTEALPITLTAITGASGTNTITIRPQAGVTGLTISGSPTPGVFYFNGADYIIIDGRPGGIGAVGDFVIENTSTATVCVIIFANDATNNIVKYCTVKGSGSSSVIGFNATLSTGNDNNTINNCTVMPSGLNKPPYMIRSYGASGMENSGNTVSNCNLVDFTIRGIYLQSYSDTWTITNNSFYQTTAFAPTTDVGMLYIWVGSNYTITGNYFGGQEPLCAGATAYTLTSSAYSLTCIFLFSYVTGTCLINSNTFQNINVTSTNSVCFVAIYATGSANYTIGSSGNGNTIGKMTGTGSIVATGNEPCQIIFRGILVNSSGSSTVAYNNFGAITANGNSTNIAAAVYLIYVGSNSGSVTVDNNTLGNPDLANISIPSDYTFYGILDISDISSHNATISNNTLQNISISSATSTKICSGIDAGNAYNYPVGTMTITDNTIKNITIGTSVFIGISNSSVSPTLTVSGNIIRNISKTAATGAFTGIENSGAVTTTTTITITITNNQLGNASGGLITYSVANSSALLGISNTAGGAGAALIITGNDIRGITHSIQGTNVHTYIYNTAATLSQNISSNTFTNLNVNTTGNVTFISNNVSLLSTGTQNVNNNSIVTGFNKTGAGGTLTLFTASATSAAGSAMNNTGNNFSNITVTGATIIAGWSNTDAGLSAKTITGNTFNNWTGGTSAVTGMTINGFYGASSVSTNTITNITGGAAITGFTVNATGFATTLALSNNTITNLTSSGTGGTVIGLASSNPSNTITINANTINTLSSTGTTATIAGISVTASGPTLNVTNNLINTLSASGITTPVMYGIYVGSLGTVSIQSNTINTVSTGGIATSGYTFNGINTSGPVGNFTISGNTIGNAVANNISVGTNGVTTTGVCTFIGINNLATGSISITGNTIQNGSAYGTAASVFTGILNSGTGTVTISSNNLIAGTLSGTGAFTGISSSSATVTLTVTGNIIRNLSKIIAATGTFTGISNSGAVTNTITITNNQLGNATGGLITYSVANSAALIGISNSGGASAAALTITGNDIRGITHSAAGSSAHTYISNTAATLSQNISSNTFTNLIVNTTGNVIFISNSVALLSTGSQNVNSNSIVTAFNKTGATNTVTLFTTAATSATGATINNTGNNFSNITVTGATTIAGWSNADGCPSTKTISGNTFAAWTGGSNAIIAIDCNNGLGSITSNIVNTITGSGAITGINLGTAGTHTASSNTINGFSSTGAVAVTGISFAGPGGSIFKNKIYDLSGNNAATTVYGIVITTAAGLQGVNVYNNIIGDLRATAANAADPIRGINILGTTATSTINVYYNTVYLNAAASSGTNCGSTGIYHTTSATATTARLNLNNNIIVNNSTIKGTGLTVAYRRSSTTLTNYASTSNNNLFYAGTPGAGYLIFYDGTNSDQTLAAFKTRVNPRESASVTENPAFLSTIGGNATFLHINTAIATQIESGAVNISTYTDDFDSDIRQGNAGYGGTGTSPDIGADEFCGLPADITAPAISYTVLGNNSCFTSPVFTATITDGTGVETTAGIKPRVWYKKSTNTNAYNDNTPGTDGWKYAEATNASSPFSFTLDLTLVNGGVAAGNIIQYFVVAQDIVTPTPNVGINSGTFSGTPASVALTTGGFAITGTINSYTILAGLSGTVNVGAGETYTTLTVASGGLFTAINTFGLAGNLTANITSDITETGATSLNAISYGCNSTPGCGNFTLTISPIGGISRTLSGTPVAGTPLINLNGADNVIIDGLNTGSNSLTISNTTLSATAGTSAIRFIADATCNTVQNCTISGSATGAANGTIFFSTGTTTGNDGNTINACTITSAGANLPTNAVYSAGTSVSVDNSGITISNNNIQDYFNAAAASNGVFVASNSSAWTISGNRFFQSATRTATAVGYIHRAINIITASGVSYTVNNNIIGYANSGGTGVTTYDGAFANRFIGIEMTAGIAAVSNIQGNTVNGFILSTTSSAAAPGIFCGISLLAGSVNIGTTSSNTIGAASGTATISITSTISGGYIAGIYVTSTGTVSIQNNTIGSVSTGGAATIGYTFNGINTAGAGGNFTISGNTIGSTATANSISAGTRGVTTTGVCTFYGINNAATGSISITGNTIQNCSAYGTAASVFTGILNSGGSGTVTINTNNLITDTLYGTGAFTGISNTSAPATLTVTGNIIRDLSKTAATGTFTGISNSGAITTTITITNNQLGNATGGLITYNIANSSALLGISNTAGGGGAALTITGNDIRGITHSAAGSGAHTYIINSAATLSQNISSNTFTNLIVNTTNNVIFISNSVALLSTGSQNVNSNSIVTAFNKTGATNTVTLFTTAATSAAGSAVNNTGNNFSNITVTGATIIAGWSNSDVGTSTKTITGNTFNNWTGGTSAVTGMTINGFGGTSSVSTNTITNITGGAAITGLTVGTTGSATTLALSNNTITNLTSSGTGGTVIGLASGNPSITITINANTINTLSSTGTTATIVGINVTASGPTLNVTNNPVNTLSASGITIPVINGISVASTGTVSIQGNTINTISTGGIATSGYTSNGINASGAVGNFTISGNTIGNAVANNISIGTDGVTTTGVCTFRGINNAATGAISITGNTVQNCSVYGTAASVFTGILNSGGITVTINSNIIGSTDVYNISLTGNAVHYGINISAAGTYTVNSNTMQQINCTNTGTTTSFRGITTVSTTTLTSCNGNAIKNINVDGTGTSAFYGINNLGTASITSNTMQDLLVDGAFYGINSGMTGGTITINSNVIGSIGVNNISLSANTSLYGISVGAGTYTVNSNTIQQINCTNTGTATSFRGITTASTTTLTSCNGNIIQNINFDGTGIFRGIENYGNASITSNIMRDLSIAGIFYGIYGGLFGGTITISSNIIGSAVDNNISLSGNYTHYGMNLGSSHTLSNNTIQEVNCTNTGTAAGFYGIYLTTGTISSVGDTVRNIDMVTTSVTNSSLAGIYLNSAATGQLIRGAYISNLNHNTGTANVHLSGIWAAGATSNSTIEKCFILRGSTDATGSAGEIKGINIAAGSWNVYNNAIIWDNGNIGVSPLLRGIQCNSTGTCNLYHNTVKMYGTATSGSGSSAAYYRDAGSGISTVKNNLFQNKRINSGKAGTGFHYAAYCSNITNLTINYNYLEVTADQNKIGQKSVTEYNFAGWQGATPTSPNDVNGTVTLNPLGSPQLPYAGANAGTNLLGTVNDDIVNASRDATPWIGAYEFENSDPPIPFPITLLSFTGFCEDGVIRLEWATASETNNDYFTIEKSSSGSGSGSGSWQWQEIAKIKGAGNSNTLLYYSFTDTELPPAAAAATFYYRLKQTDYDGKYEYFGPVAVSCSDSEDGQLSLNWYIIDGELILNVFSAEAAEAKLLLINVIGQTVFEKRVMLSEGNNKISLDKTKLVNAGYFGVVTTETRYAATKLVFVK